MFEAGDYIIYSSTGVCRVEEIKTESFCGESRNYYILKPIYAKNSTIHAPVGKSESKMKRLISPEDARSLIKSIPDEETIWIEDDTQRKERFSEILREGDRTELIRLIKTLYYKREEKLKSGRKFHISDERIMKDAERVLYEEFASVLNISPGEVVSFISAVLEGKS